MHLSVINSSSSILCKCFHYLFCCLNFTGKVFCNFDLLVIVKFLKYFPTSDNPPHIILFIPRAWNSFHQFTHINVYISPAPFASAPILNRCVNFSRLLCGQNEQKDVELQLRLKGPGQEEMRGLRAASFLFCFSGVPSHGPGSTMVGAMAERHQDI